MKLNHPPKNIFVAKDFLVQILRTKMLQKKLKSGLIW